MSIAAIRESRGVPAKIGGRVRYTGAVDGKPREGTIIGTRGGYIDQAVGDIREADERTRE